MSAAIKQRFATVIREHYPAFTGEVEIAQARDLRFGDLASPIAFVLAKTLGRSPQDIARELVPHLAEALKPDAMVEVSVGAPFINVILTAEGWRTFQQSLYDRREQLGRSNTLAGQKINVEFISANPTGPLTLANGRGGFAGDALGNVLEAAGAEVEREYYYNDSGNQIMELGRSVLAAREGVEIDGGYRGDYVQELAKRIETDDPYTAGQQAADYIFNTWIKPMIERMGIAFTRYASEQSLIDQGTVEKVHALLEQEQRLYEKEGALWLKTMDLGEDKDRVVKRSDGTYTYLMKDIAYHWDKIERGADHLVTMVGADHFTEARTLEAIVRTVLAPALDWQGTFRQPIIQFVRLMRNGEEVKMSKRAGAFVTIDDLLDEINPDVARFFFLMRSLESHMDFDLTLAKEASDENPVYYVQYAYVRAKHILEKAEAAIYIAPASLEPEERKLWLHLETFPHLIGEVAASYEVHRLTHYAIDVARLFHAFYTKHPVLKADEPQRSQRLALTAVTFAVLRQILNLIGVSQPERMVATALEQTP